MLRCPHPQIPKINKQTNPSLLSLLIAHNPNNKQTPHLCPTPPTLACIHRPSNHMRCAAGSGTPGARLPGTRCLTRQGSCAFASPPPHCPAGFIPSTAGLRGVTAAFTNNVRKHVLLCVAVVVMCPVRSVCATGLVALPKCPTR